MTSLLRFNPLADALWNSHASSPWEWLDRMEEWFRQPYSPLSEPLRGAGAWAPALDLLETDDAYTLHVDVPGVQEKSISLELDGDMLSVSGERPESDSDEGYLRREVAVGDFMHQIRLPGPVAEDQVTANYANGLLTVILPKQAQPGPRRIELHDQ